MRKALLILPLLAVILTGCPAAKAIVQEVPEAGICDLAAVESGSMFWGVICSDLIQTVKDGVANYQTQKAQGSPEASPCKLQAIKRGGVYVGSVCDSIAPDVQARVDALAPDAGL